MVVGASGGAIAELIDSLKRWMYVSSERISIDFPSCSRMIHTCRSFFELPSCFKEKQRAYSMRNE
jgi:hypothetical protein